MQALTEIQQNYPVVFARLNKTKLPPNLDYLTILDMLNMNTIWYSLTDFEDDKLYDLAPNMNFINGIITAFYSVKTLFGGENISLEIVFPNVNIWNSESSPGLFEMREIYFSNTLAVSQSPVSHNILFAAALKKRLNDIYEVRIIFNPHYERPITLIGVVYLTHPDPQFMEGFKRAIEWFGYEIIIAHVPLHVN